MVAVAGERTCETGQRKRTSAFGRLARSVFSSNWRPSRSHALSSERRASLGMSWTAQSAGVGAALERRPAVCVVQSAGVGAAREMRPAVGAAREARLNTARSIWTGDTARISAICSAISRPADCSRHPRPVRDAEPRLAPRLPEQSEPHVASRPDRAPRPIAPGPRTAAHPPLLRSRTRSSYSKNSGGARPDRRTRSRPEERSSARSTRSHGPNGRRTRRTSGLPAPAPAPQARSCVTSVRPMRRPRVLARAPSDT